MPEIPDVAEPLKIEVFIAPVCPYCAHAVETVNKAVHASKNLESWIVDAIEFPESAVAYGVKSTPTIVVNGEPRWVGKITFDDFKGLLKTEHDWGVNLKSQVAAGSVDEAVETALNHPESVKGIVELLAAEEFSSRLGALRIVEETAGQIPDAFKTIVPDLCGLARPCQSPDSGGRGLCPGVDRRSRRERFPIGTSQRRGPRGPGIRGRSARKPGMTSDGGSTFSPYSRRRKIVTGY